MLNQNLLFRLRDCDKKSEEGIKKSEEGIKK